MKRNLRLTLPAPILLTVICTLSTVNVSAQSSKEWEVELPKIGTHSSPRAVDLNGDGVLDLVIGCSKKEFEANDTAIIAVDGVSGKVLWRASARDQVYGSAAI